MTRCRPLALLGALALVATGGACSSDRQQQVVNAAPQTAATTPAATGGMRVYRDPETGKLRSAPAEMRARKDPVTGEYTMPPAGTQAPDTVPAAGLLVPPTAAIASKPKVFRHADGSIDFDIRERIRTYTRATRDTDGKLTIEHLDGSPPVTVQR